MQGKRIIYAMLCLLLLLGALQAFAQEETETPLPPPTEPLATVPSATFTPLPTNTASATMTSTATETSSPTNTLTATNTHVVPSETSTTTFTPVATTETLMPIDTATTTFTPSASTETQTATAPEEVTDSVEIGTTATVDSNAYAIRGLESNASPSVSQFGDTPSTNQINQTMSYLTDFETTVLSPPTIRIDDVSLPNTTLVVAVPSSFPPEYGDFSARTSLPALQTSQLSVTVNLNEAHTIFGINNYNYVFPLIPSARVQHYYTYNDVNGNIIEQSSICDDGYNPNNCRPIMPFGVADVWSITVHLDYIDATHPNPSSIFLDNISFTASIVTASTPGNVIIVDSTGNVNQVQASSDIVTTNIVEVTGNNGICDIFEAIALTNYLSDAENFTEPVDSNGISNEDCTPSQTNETLSEGVYEIMLSPNTYIFTEEQLIGGNVVISTGNPTNYATITRLDIFEDEHRLLNVTGSLTLENIIISNGYADNGGGILNAGNLVLNNSSLIGNYASAGGGAIYNLASGSVTITNSLIYQNSSSATGGAVTNFGQLSITSSRLSQNFINNSISQGGAIFSDSLSLNVSNSCITLNTARDGGGIFNQSNTPATISNNWWGHPSGPTLNSIGATQGALGDVITGLFELTQSAPDVSSLELNIPNISTLPCFELDSLYYQETIQGRWGRPELAIEVVLRVNLLIGRNITLEEIFATTLWEGASSGQFSDIQLHGFTESLGRNYFEFGDLTRSLRCPEIFVLDQINYQLPGIEGMLCTLSSFSEWFGQEKSAEFHAYEIQEFILSNQINSASPNSQYSWLQRANMITNSSTRVMFSNTNNCFDWENGQPNSTEGQCLWNWGNYSLLSTKEKANERINNSSNSINTTDAFNDPVYTAFNANEPESNIRWSFALIDREEGNVSEITPMNLLPQDFFLFTWNQYSVLLCRSQLTYVGNFPVCR